MYIGNIPFQLAYNNRSFDRTIIVPYSVLIFDNEMVKIVPKK
jgi:FKBP-type peptidyl-prolyl cis-trans isomerase